MSKHFFSTDLSSENFAYRSKAKNFWLEICKQKNSLQICSWFFFQKTGRIRAVSAPYQGRIRAVSEPYQGRIKSVSGPYHGRNWKLSFFSAASWLKKICYRSVSKICCLQICSKKNCFRSVRKNFLLADLELKNFCFRSVKISLLRYVEKIFAHKSEAKKCFKDFSLQIQAVNFLLTDLKQKNISSRSVSKKM